MTSVWASDSVRIGFGEGLGEALGLGDALGEALGLGDALGAGVDEIAAS